MIPQGRTEMYRMRALFCEQRAKRAPDAVTRQDWEDLAIEWHALASFAGRESREDISD